MNQAWVSATEMCYSPRVTRRRPRVGVKYSGELWDDDAVFQGAEWVN